jgi:hypothetical protein
MNGNLIELAIKSDQSAFDMADCPRGFYNICRESFKSYLINSSCLLYINIFEDPFLLILSGQLPST